MIRIAELEQTFKDIFDEEGGLVQSVETTYEKSQSGDFYKLVISIHADYSIFDVKYEPKFKTTPCDKTTFDFEVDVNNNYKFDVSIYKIDRSSDDSENDTYRYQFKFMDDIETIESDTLRNIHFTIGSNIARILDKKLK